MKVGDILNACEKCQGLKKGEKINKLCQIRVVSTKKEKLYVLYHDKKYGEQECINEGFPGKKGAWFAAMFAIHNKCDVDETVNRIEFVYI